MACKKHWTCWLPHNWLCLKSLYWIFVVLFYCTFAYTLYGAIYYIWQIRNPMVSQEELLAAVIPFAIMQFGALLGGWTMIIILRALRKIKKAVAPCCCHEEKNEETK